MAIVIDAAARISLAVTWLRAAGICPTFYQGTQEVVMIVANDIRLEPAALERTIERRINERTRGRIRGIQVAIDDNRVTVRGVSPTYYIKQLAIHALLENLESQMTPVVDIVVT